MDEKRLSAFEAMLCETVEEAAQIEHKLAQLRENGRVKSATYQQLFAMKLTYETLLNLYAKHGLWKK